MRFSEKSVLTVFPGPAAPVQNPQWSWQVHSGIIGIANPQGGDVLGDRGFVPESPDFYKEILAAVIHEFQLDKHDDKIVGKLDAAYWRPLDNVGFLSHI